MSVNKVFLTGNLTRDPRLSQTSGGFTVLDFGLAVNERRKSAATGQWEDYANYIDCSMFGNRAEAVSRYLSKGCKVTVEGKLHWRQWQAQDGRTRSKLDVIVDEIELMSKRAGGAMQPETARAYQSMGVPASSVDLSCEDIPF